ncbi:hypothetical protein FGO68_gene14921 [Halteria grandinella]|uniref:Uncharacterized protein n=1 Tax=Halteria grandinella TaxID=5974 RepID=A0A8J8NFD4_HALGN|nr:hypothetical protein FGO68_gene14921 [Halteria grandinella]
MKMMHKKTLLLLALALALFISSSFAAEQGSFREALAAEPEIPVRSLKATVDPPTPIRDVTMRQTFIWSSIILGVTLFFAVMALFNMDQGKEKDTILYAKFLRVEDAMKR